MGNGGKREERLMTLTGWLGYGGYGTYVFGLISTILTTPEGRRSAMCVLGRM